MSDAIAELDAHDNIKVAHYDMRFLKPLDKILLERIFENHQTIITIEDGVLKGGFGSVITQFAIANGYKNAIKTLGIQDAFLEQGSIANLQKEAAIDSSSIRLVIKELLSKRN